MMHLLNNRLTGVLIVGCLFLSATSARAAVVWNETVNGDISTNRNAPSSAALVLGANTLTATSVGPSSTADREYIHFSMPPETRLRAIYLDAYSGLDETAFIAVQAGTTFTEPPSGTNVANLLGYNHFGPAIAPVGTNILPGISDGPGSMGFSPPLPSNDYTFWIQQTGASAVTYTLNFEVVPEPCTLAILGFGGVLLIGAKCRRRAMR